MHGVELTSRKTDSQQSDRVTPDEMKKQQTENNFNTDVLKPSKRYERKITPSKIFETICQIMNQGVDLETKIYLKSWE